MMQSSAIGTKSMVTSPHYLASMAGARILQKGGNAFDAAVAVSACLAVVYPHMTGVGGDAFWLMYSKDDGQVRAYNASGRSGKRADLSAYEGEAAIPMRGARSAITVPGMVDGWDAVIREYGRLALSEVLEPALEYARDGIPLFAKPVRIYRNLRGSVASVFGNGAHLCTERPGAAIWGNVCAAGVG